jgi:hypothetical protein
MQRLPNVPKPRKWDGNTRWNLNEIDKSKSGSDRIK